MHQTQSRKRNPYHQAIRSLRNTFLLVGLFSAAINILMLTGPIYMLQVYDRVLSSSSVATLQGLFVIVVVLYVFLGFYEFLRSRLLSRASYRLDMQVGGKSYDFWMRSANLQDRPRENLMQDIEVVRGFLASPAVLGIFDLPWIPVFLGLVFFIHPWLGYLTLGGAVVVGIAAFLNQYLTQRHIGESMSMESNERSFLERVRRNSEAVHALGMQSKLQLRWTRLHESRLASAQRGGDRSEAFSAFSKSFRLLLQSMLLTLGAYLAIHQEVTAGAIVATSIIAGRALAPVDQVIGQWRSIARAREAHRRLTTTLDNLPPERYHIRLPAPKGHLQVIQVSKLMPGATPLSDRPNILDRISFTLSPGDGLGVIGNSAAGKSSLAKILVGAWTPDAGEVRLDGATLDQWRPEDLGKHIGYLPQQLEMLPGSIAENISRFDLQAEDSQIIEAAQIAGVHEMILALPGGYSTQIGTPAQPLSGGQIQRLGLARAIYGTPRLIVLDEPNSNLDSQGDEALTAAIQKLRDRGAVVIVMAHRPSAISTVNKVMIMHKGMILQFGNKDELLRTTTPIRMAPNPAPNPAPGQAADKAADKAPSPAPAPAAATPMPLALAARAKMFPAAAVDQTDPASLATPPATPAAVPTPAALAAAKKIGQPG
ncbi:type I secretion system permease/ATPase [Rhodobacter sp. Har01]|uniref:type I secretion system permease/ATPase n=1 Tax=Rhodobacter sp. Har01 TaxID=2883999 RepID=UPI001D0678B0|nr:type I secretion system permease/ATPase [Rhodobacter sp. Har01]MCB6179332.1 type I secretion system permease/ATPase [Rhodobacter sp. Har01]